VNLAGRRVFVYVTTPRIATELGNLRDLFARLVAGL
jgi:hypothetical protein